MNLQENVSWQWWSDPYPCGCKVPYKTYTPEYLRDVEGDFVSSAFVEEQIGVGNVCERSAGAASSGGEKLVGKTADNGVTVAIYRVAQKNKE